ncbi:MAG: amino acid adenylation domain-containing protein [Nitrosomonas sp.]
MANFKDHIRHSSKAPVIQFKRSYLNTHQDSHDISNLVTLLQYHAQKMPQQCAYIFLHENERMERSINFAELDMQVRKVAVQLQRLKLRGQRALLVYPAGIEYIIAFMGCLYAGVIAVPVYPPSKHYAYRLKAIIRDAIPSAVLTTQVLQNKLQENHQKDWESNELIWLATDVLSDSDSKLWMSSLTLAPSDLAFLQYTSGSTGDPKGVMISHGNLMANQEAIRKAFHHSNKTIVVGWLPLYHDMGLIGNVLQPLYLGTTAVLMSPLTFLEHPVRWLYAISKYRATTSGGPNFAYELCVRKVTTEQKKNLDLSNWKLAFNGSEPVRIETLRRFANAFAECGFHPESFFPCYGLAEGTLLVTGNRLQSLHHQHSQTLDRNDCEQLDPNVSRISSGTAWNNHAVCIVNPKTRVPCVDGEEGEIWIMGDSVAQGYWNRTELSKSTFRAVLSLPDQEGDLSNDKIESIHQIYFDHLKHTFLRSGDLGLVEKGELFVTGRIKDLIILRGRNYYPHDFEQAIDDHVAGIRANCCAAFSVERAGEEELIIAVEVRRKKITKQFSDELLTKIRQILVQTSDAPIGELILLPPGAILKTSSGKIQRQAIKQAYLDKQLVILARRRHGDPSESSVIVHTVDPERSVELLHEIQALPDDQRIPMIVQFLQLQLAKILQIPVANLMLTDSIRMLGLDSLSLVEFKHRVDTQFGTEFPLALFLSELSISELANELVTTVNHVSFASNNKTHVPQSLQDASLSCAQQAIWAVHQLESNSIVYNLHICLHFQGIFNNALFHRAIEQLFQRHSQLRTCYRMIGGSVQQHVIPCEELSAYFFAVDASQWRESTLQEDVIKRIREPFELSTGPLLRVTNYHLNKQSHIVLFCAHHAAVDLWTSMVLLRDLKAILQNLMFDKPLNLPRLSAEYQDFVDWQQRYLQSSDCQTDWDFWQKKLMGTLPVLALSTDFPRSRVSDFRGASSSMRLSLDLTHKLKQLGKQHGATLFMTLLAVYKVLLHRYTHQNDIIVGTASNGRSQARFKDVAGYFVNPIALRTYPHCLLSFAAYLIQVRDTVIDALAHSNYPFSLLVERLQPERSYNHWPIYQTLLVVQQDPAVMDDALAQLTLGEGGCDVSWGNWKLSSKRTEEHVENFDLRLMAAEDEYGLLLSFKYRTDLFESESITRMANHFQRLLEQIIAQPDLRLGDFSLLTESEYTQQLSNWNAITKPLHEARCLHELFEAQVALTPRRIAVSCDGEQLTYAELNQRANRLAHYLRAQNIGPEVVVGLCVRRSLEMIVGILGILKAGGAYVPIDPNFPETRIESILNDSQAAFIITQPSLARKFSRSKLSVLCLELGGELDGKQSHTNPKNMCRSGHLAYIIYTSGSTGKSKGVAITHGSVVYSTQARFDTYHERIKGFLLLSSYTFDSSVAGIFWTLCQGGCLHIPAEGAEIDPQLLGKILSTETITHLLCLPSFYSLLLESLPQQLFDNLKMVVVAGEACFPDLVVKHHLSLPHVAIFNEYGPTEGTVWSSVSSMQADDVYSSSVPIGKPIQHVQIYILDRFLNPVPVGIPGEIYIGGVGLARGYQQAPDLTAERFIPNFFTSTDNNDQAQLLNCTLTGNRLYRTGDLARYRSDGSIEFLGRIDHQVKIRGFRIELGEIEIKLRQHPGVKEAVVLVREHQSGDKRLIAYLVADSTPFLDYVVCHNENFDTDHLLSDLMSSLAACDEGKVSKQLSNQYLQQFLKNNLPDYMVPSAFVFMNKFPQLPNGKINREMFPEIEHNSSGLIQDLVEPSNSIERILLEAWKRVLNTDQLFGIHENFFDLGGHSLSAIRLIGLIQDEFKIELPVASIFEAPTIKQLSQLIIQQQMDGQDHNLLESLLDDLEQLPDETGFIDDPEITSARWFHD